MGIFCIRFLQKNPEFFPSLITSPLPSGQFWPLDLNSLSRVIHLIMFYRASTTNIDSFGVIRTGCGIMSHIPQTKHFIKGHFPRAGFSLNSVPGCFLLSGPRLVDDSLQCCSLIFKSSWSILSSMARFLQWKPYHCSFLFDFLFNHPPSNRLF